MLKITLYYLKSHGKKVQARFALLFKALGSEFDGRIEGINLQESSIGVTQKQDVTFTPKIYVQALKTNMSLLKQAFPVSTTIFY